MSKTKSLHHFVISTKYRKMTIPEKHKRSLYNYIWGVISNRKCHLHRINGIGNHIHMLIDVHPTVSLASLVKDIKISSYNWLKANPDFHLFEKWTEGYYASSISPADMKNHYDYIVSQEQHHLSNQFDDEIKHMLAGCGLCYHPNDFT